MVLFRSQTYPVLATKKNMASAGCDVTGWTPRMELPPFPNKSLSANMQFCQISMETRFPLNEQEASVTRKVVKSILGVNLVRLWQLLIDPGADNHFLNRKNKTFKGKDDSSSFRGSL